MDLGRKAKRARRVEVRVGVEKAVQDPLTALNSLKESVQSIEAIIVEWVHAARAEGRTWEEIGSALGISRQAAWERFSV